MAARGIDLSLSVLAKSRNEAAVLALLPLLASSDQESREAALRTLAARRRCPFAYRELLRRWETFSDEHKSTVSLHSSRISAAIRDAVLGSDQELRSAAMEAALWLREYDLAPTLINAAEDASNPDATVAAETLLKLTELLFEELMLPRDYKNRRDPQLVSVFVVGSLEPSVDRFDQHHRQEIIEAFLLLAHRDNALLRRVLLDPKPRVYRSVVDSLNASPRPGVMRLLLSYLDDMHPPAGVLDVISRRHDLEFVRGLCLKIGREPSSRERSNLKRINTLRWVRDNPGLLLSLENDQQHTAVRTVLASGMNRLRVFEFLKFVLLRGGVGGRRAASAALEEFSGAEANELIPRCLEDEDPQVQANVLPLLRKRGLPNAMTLLLRRVDSPSDVVRRAARKCLSEFNFRRYLAAFDVLSEGVRASTGSLVRKIDPAAVEILEEELTAPSRNRRLRALMAAPAIQAVAEVNTQIIGLLSDDDHFIRAEAARALQYCDSPESKQALRAALLDRSVMVQEAAEDSLQRIAEQKTETGFAPEELSESAIRFEAESSDAGPTVPASQGISE